MFASVGSILKLHSWSNNQLEQISTFNPRRSRGSSSKIINLSWCHDNSYIALLPEDNQPQIVSSKDRTNVSLVHTINALKDVTSLTFKNNTKRNVALGNKAGEVVIYDTKNRNISSKIDCLSDAVRLLEFNSRDNQLAVMCDNGINIFADYDGALSCAKVIQEPQMSTTIKFHPSITNLIAVGSENGTVALWDTDKEQKLLQYQKHSSAITGVAFAVNQKLMVTTGMDKKVCVLDNATTECLFRMGIHQGVTAVDISPDDLYIAVGLEDGCICIYDIRDPLKRLGYSKTHNGSVNKVAFERGPVLIESLHDGHSFTTLNDSEFGENNKFEGAHIVEPEQNESFEEKLKRDVIKMVKTHMAYLESRLVEHCSKFQSFISNEFDSIHNAMARWDVFNVHAVDYGEVANSIETTVEAKSAKSCSTRKSTNHQLSV